MDELRNREKLDWYRRDAIKALIVSQFNETVKGRKPELEKFNPKHDGRVGDWLTKQMNLTVNARNEPDFSGFEMKKDSPGKTTFGDWPPDSGLYIGKEKVISRYTFLEIFGRPNPKKNNRLSWSGKVFPKVGKFNEFGQGLFMDDRFNVEAKYKFSLDGREEKYQLIPSIFKSDQITLVTWSHSKLKSRFENKFDQLGWFKCLQDKEGIFTSIQFGLPIDFKKFIELFLKGDVYIDCGMYDGNPRPYMPWRANKNIWDALTEPLTDSKKHNP